MSCGPGVRPGLDASWAAKEKMLIDVHAHQFPNRYAEHMERQGRPLLGVLAGPSLEQRIEQMDHAHVDLQVLSPSNLVPYFPDENSAQNAARIVNDGYAELVQRMPARFKAYVSLPLPHVEASLREMERGLDQLGMAGVTFGCSILSRPVTGQEFEPLYEEMNRRRAILFFHPVVNGICAPLITDFGLEGAAGTTIEDTLVVLQMIVRQIPCRYPDIKMIVPHFGGLIPMLLARMDNQIGAMHPDLPEKPSLTACRFYYDTVGHGSRAALRCACEAFGPDHLVTGSDYPVLLAFESYARTFDYIRDAGLDQAVTNQILNHSAGTLFDV
jgi:predicted TIM-barrel fold metal-dependent hydrolase